MFLEYLEDLGYSTQDIKVIKKSISINSFTESSFLFNMKNIIKYFLSNGISTEEFKYITLTTPVIITTSLENIKILVNNYKSLGFSSTSIFLMFKNYPYLLEIPFSTMKAKYDSLIDLGFSKDSLIDIITNYPNIVRKDITGLHNKINSFLIFGFSMEQIIKIFSLYPSLFDIKSNSISSKLSKLETFGFNNYDLISLVSNNPLLLVSDNFINDYYSELIEYGYSELDIISIIKKVPYIIKEYYLERSILNIHELEKLGFSKENILILTSNNPYLLLYSSDDFISKYNCVKNYGFSHDRISNLFLKAPILFCYSIVFLKNKFDFYKKNDYINYIFDNPSKVIINVDYLNKRIRFLEEKKLLSDQNKEDIFLDDIMFYNKYKINRLGLEES